MARQKNLQQALRFITELTRTHPDTHFDIVGRDDGELTQMQALASDLGIASNVIFHGELDFDQIRPLAAESSFYLQTSTFEGMGMAVAEAMQLGLVPIVTPVGEIQHYCRHLDNAVVFSSLEQALEDTRHLLADPAAYQRLRRGAIDQWRAAPPYHIDFVKAADELCHA